MKREYLTLSLMAVAGWLSLSQAEEVKPPIDETVLLEEWHGEYLMGKKVGYSYTKIWQRKGESSLQTRSITVLPSMKAKIRTDAEAEEDGRLRAFACQADFGGATIRCSGEVRGSTLALVYESAGTTSVKKIPLDKPVIEEDVIPYLVVKASPSPGDRLEYSTVFPITASLQPMQIEVLGWEDLERGGQPIKALKIKIRYMQETMTSWLDSNGSTIESESEVLSARSVRESKATTEEFGDFAALNQLDLIRKMSIKTNIDLPEGDFIKRIKANLTSVPENIKIASDTWQRVLSREGETVSLEIGFKTEDHDEKPDPIWLESSVLVQSDHPEISGTASDVVGNATADVEKVRRLISWMNRTITQELRISVPSALEILRSRRGDCNEYATLFAALARSLGIPTKICVGVVYMNGQFAYHAWNEVYLAEENPSWQPVDSTFSQFPADATHIKFSEGDLENHLAIAGLLGRLKIDILEYDTKEL